MDLNIFIGRFHPLIVHFPISLLTAAILFEYLSKIPRFRKLANAVPALVLLGSISALISLIMGWLLAGDRGYEANLLFWHRWLGVSLFILSVIITLSKFNIVEIGKELRHTFQLFILVLVAFTGHLGGSLTHGRDYLYEYAPEVIRENFMTEVNASPLIRSNPDSIYIYKDLIQVILENHCVDCHDQNQKKGGLDLSSPEGILAGGDGGKAFVANDPFSSEIFKRVSLPSNHKKFMPLKDDPLSYGQIQLISWWIKHGASFDQKLSGIPYNDEIKAILLRDFQIDPTPKPVYETLTVQIPPQVAIDGLRSKGIEVQPIAQGNNFVQVKFLKGHILDDESIQYLDEIRENITWLDLSRSNIDTEEFSILSQFNNLTDLNASWIDSGNEIAGYVAALPYLAKINFTGTNLSETSLNTLGELSGLTLLYLWNSGLEEPVIENFRKTNDQISVVSEMHAFN